MLKLPYCFCYLFFLSSHYGKFCVVVLLSAIVSCPMLNPDKSLNKTFQIVKKRIILPSPSNCGLDVLCSRCNVGVEVYHCAGMKTGYGGYFFQFLAGAKLEGLYKPL